MKTIQKILILLAILIAIIIIVILIVLSKIKNGGTDSGYGIEFEEQINYEAEEKLQLVDNKNKYFAVESILNSYFSHLEGINGDKHLMYQVTDANELASIKQEMFEESYLAISNMLENSNEFKEYTSKEMVKQEGAKFKSYNPIINKMLISEKSASINVFILEISVGNVETKIAIKTDSENMTFSIIPMLYVEKYNYDNNTLLEKISDEAITKNSNNTYNYKNITDEYIARTYFNTYKNNALKNVEKAYNSLDKDYAKKRFGSLENYKQYITNNKEVIEKLQITKYQHTNNDDYEQYVCIDSNGKYYIFRQTAIMQYTLFLDTYTIDLPEYIEKYNKSNQQQKTALNIDKFVKAINDENYTVAYSFLSDGFKDNYFKGQSQFEQYAKQNFLGKSEVTYSEFEAKGNVYTYNVILENPKDEVSSIQKTFNVRLKDGTDFEMSFNMD